jgi:hypothetical protein
VVVVLVSACLKCVLISSKPHSPPKLSPSLKTQLPMEHPCFLSLIRQVKHDPEPQITTLRSYAPPPPPPPQARDATAERALDLAQQYYEE